MEPAGEEHRLIEIAPPFALGLLASSALVWVGVRRFRRAAWGQAWFLAERRWILWRYHRTGDGRRYDPDRNPEVALLGPEIAPAVRAPTPGPHPPAAPPTYN